MEKKRDEGEVEGRKGGEGESKKECEKRQRVLRESRKLQVLLTE